MNKITKDNLIANMIKKMEAFNDEEIEITKDTVHKDVLDEEPGFMNTPSQKQAYADVITNTVHRNGGTAFKWPGDWMEKTVEEIADFIISKQIYE